MSDLFAALAGAAVLAAGALVGGVAPGNHSLWQRHRDALVTVSAGLLTGTAMLHLLPHAASTGDLMGYLVLSGFLGVLLLEVAIHRGLEPPPAAPGADHGHDHHHAHSHDHGHAHGGTEGEHLSHDGVDAHERHLAVSALLGFSLHGMVDGVGLMAAASTQRVGSTALALLMHHVPLAASCAAMLKLGGRRRSYWPLLVLSSLTPALGVLVAAAGREKLADHLCGVAAGVFLYVATHNLLPVMDVPKQRGSRLLILLGGAGFAALTKAMGGD